MFLLIFLVLLFTNYIIVADMEEKYKIGYGVGLFLITALALLMKFL